jgi:hypothetical protein
MLVAACAEDRLIGRWWGEFNTKSLGKDEMGSLIYALFLEAVELVEQIRARVWDGIITSFWRRAACRTAKGLIKRLKAFPQFFDLTDTLKGKTTLPANPSCIFFCAIGEAMFGIWA